VLFVSERSGPVKVPSVTDLAMGQHSISGVITNKKQPVAGVLVRLDMILPQDSIYNDEELDEVKPVTENGAGFKKVYLPDSAGKRRLQQLTAYARTNEQGICEFKNLPEGKAFKVLPLQPGYQFGTSQGVQNLDDESLTFNQSPHTIRLFSTKDFNILKKEKSLSFVPHRSLTIGSGSSGSFIAAFLFVHLLLSWKFSTSDQLILPVVMILTGLSFLTLLSLQDPLRDRFWLRIMLVYLGIGLVALLVMLQFNLRRFTPDSWMYRMLVFKHNRNALKWLALGGTGCNYYWP
jgi:hypothetical protein